MLIIVIMMITVAFVLVKLNSDINDTRNLSKYRTNIGGIRT